ncbi:hypothetical protein HW532_05145 [Kaustia mangrovi]|uniref:DUF1127 domain-containing protein n=1 Tax=Kaustia mangrovi TaxID=2593653 RepID=A0A7S8C2G2_9HYPH|nr:hypothetical protein [Kaustia mangrovi]QPC42140.1 hypothetical protein HW532_05145 [Kaustia mangrovi]
MRTSVLAQGHLHHAGRLHMPAVFHNWLVRQRLKKLLGVDERILDDMGLTRSEVFWALDLPLSVNPAVELQRRAQARRDQSFAHRVNRGRRQIKPVSAAAA